MRELKFRAWNGDEMVFSDRPQDTKGVRIKHGEVCLAEAYWFDGWDSASEIVVDAEIMQYTGLKDKNGVEIYESDLLEVCENTKGVLLVEFKNEYVGGWVLSNPSSVNHFSLGARAESELAVIGNIYENPELLEVAS